MATSWGKEKTKGIKVRLRSDRSVVTTRNVTDIEALKDTTNKLVLDALKRVDDGDLGAVALSYARTARTTRRDAVKREEGLTYTRNNKIQKP